MRLDWGTAPISALQILEIGLTLLCIGLAVFFAGLGNRIFSRVEDSIRRLSDSRWLGLLSIAALPIVLRVLLLPVYGVPWPFISDEYAYLLQSDTFASGRLTNPSPPMPEHFASVYVLTNPTYAAEYQIAQGLLLALGQVLTGIPWVGVVLSMAALCVTIYWALLGCLPRVWAFAGTLVIVDIQLGVLSYWMNSYWGGCAPAIGGALVFGGLIRLRDGARILYSFVVAAGLAILINSRPFEGVLWALISLGTVLYWILFSRQLTFRTAVARIFMPAVLVLGAAASFIGYYNYCVTGRATEFPYLLYRDRYGVPQGFFWQKPVLVNAPMPTDIKAEYEDQLEQHERRNSVEALVLATGGKLRRFWDFYIGVPFTLTLLFLPFIWRERNMGLAACALVLIVGFANLTFFAYFPHYSAAVMVPIVLVLIHCLRRMRNSGFRGLFLSRALPVVSLLGLMLPFCSRIFSVHALDSLWTSEFEHEISREKFVPGLERQPGRQIVLVRYDPGIPGKKKAWVYNKADIENSKIVWARESPDAESNRKLLKAFPGRTVWLAKPDTSPPGVSPYPLDSLQR